MHNANDIAYYTHIHTNKLAISGNHVDEKNGNKNEDNQIMVQTLIELHRLFRLVFYMVKVLKQYDCAPIYCAKFANIC